jgi:hypothetical protein
VPAPAPPPMYGPGHSRLVLGVGPAGRADLAAREGHTPLVNASVEQLSSRVRF